MKKQKALHKETNNNSIELRQLAEASLQERLQSTMPTPPEDLQRVVHELSVHQIELEMQKEELLQSRESLEHALDRFVDLYDFAPVGYLTLDSGCRIVEVNLTASKMLGVDRSLLQGDRFTRFVALKDADAFNLLFDQVFSHKEPRSGDLTLQLDWKDEVAASIVHFEATISQNGQECRLTISDITDQVKIAQENARLQASKKEWETTINSLFVDFPDPVLLLDRHYTILAANQAFAILPPDLRKERLKIIEKSHATAKPVTWEDEQDGANLRHTVYPIADKTGEITQFLIIVQNVTATKKIELQLKKEQLLNQAIIKSVPGVFYILDQDGRIAGGNDYLLKEVIGNRDGDITSIDSMELIHPDDREEANEILRNVIENDSVEGIFEGRVLLQGRPEYRWFVLTARQFTIDGKMFVLGMGIDITSHKQSEQALVESEYRFRKLFESHAAVKIILNPENGCIVDANQAAADFYGWSINELRKMNISQIAILSIKELKKELKKCFEEGKNHFEFRNHLADGSLRDVEVFSTIVEINDKRFIYAIIFDITERKRLEALSDTIVTTDVKGIITNVTSIGINFYGKKAGDELLGKPFSFLVLSRDEETWHELLEKALQDRAIQRGELLLKRINKAIYSAEVTVTLIDNYYEAPQSFMIVIRDISQRKLIESEHLFNKSLLELGEMASGIAHEIYQPINTIGLVVDKMLVEANKYSGEIKENLTITSKKILYNIGRMESIVDNIRTFSGTEKKSSFACFDSNKIIRSALDISSQQCANKGIDILFKAEEEIFPVSGNIYKFEQVMLNLIKNAIDALEEKKLKSGKEFNMKIAIHSYRDNNSLIIKLQDNGVGIGKEEIDYLYQPFYTTKAPGKGVGLGIPISQKIIKEMHGNMLIESKPMKGTTVTLTLPVKEKTS